MATQDEVTEAFVKRSLTLLRAGEGEAAEASKKLRRIHKQIIREIESTLGENPSPASIARLEEDIDKRLRSFYKEEWPEQLREIEMQTILKEVRWQEELLIGVTGENVVRTSHLGPVVEKARKLPYQGKTFRRWINGAFRSDRNEVIAVLESGFKAGKSIAEVTQEVGAIVGRVDRDVKTITRSFMMHNAQTAKHTVADKNPDLVEGYIWVSTLDSRTTPLICGVRDGLLYDREFNPIGHGESWDGGPGRIHWNCRSVAVDKIKGVKQTGQRAAVGPGKNYERGDNKTRTGKVRKPHKDARDKGIYKIDQKTTRSRYEGWLREQSRKNLDFVADVLGSKEKARAFRDGTATLQTLRLESPVANTLKLSDI